MAKNIFECYEIPPASNKSCSERVPQIVDHKAQAGILANAIVRRLQLPDVIAGNTVTWEKPGTIHELNPAIQNLN